MTTTIISQAAAPKTSQHIGKIGDRVRVEGVVRKMLAGRAVLHIIHDIDGNEFTVRRSKSLVRKPGALVLIEANVIGHSEFRGVKRTDLSSGTEFSVTDDHAFLAKREG